MNFLQNLFMDSPKTALQFKECGDKAFKQRDYVKSVDMYTQSLSIDRYNSTVYSNRASCYFKLGKFDLSLIDCKESISLNSSHFRPWFTMGLIYIEMNDLKSAISNFGTASSLNPESKEIITKLHECDAMIKRSKMDHFSSPLQERFVASCVLAGVGDVMGYKNGDWEFTFRGDVIHREMENLYGSISGINCSFPKWIVSDDTVMHLATGEALITGKTDLNDIMSLMAERYVICWDDMSGRASGPTCASGVNQLRNGKWDRVKYDKRGGGCGGSMRSMCIGLRYPGKENRKQMIAVSIESGRLTHNHPTGFLGAMVAAAFTAYAIEGIPVKKWGYLLLNELLPLSREYLKECGRDWGEIKGDMLKFEEQFVNYLKIRGVSDGESEPVFPENYGVIERDTFYKKWSFNGWAGASGDDSCIGMF